jgi:hypothetical protein
VAQVEIGSSNRKMIQCSLSRTPKKRMRPLRSVVATVSVFICLLQIALRHGDSERTPVDAKLHLPLVITILYGDS